MKNAKWERGDVGQKRAHWSPARKAWKARDRSVRYARYIDQLSRGMPGDQAR